MLEIKKFNDKILRKKAKEIKAITPGIKQLVLNMVETMKENNGIGLAGNQVDQDKRIIIIQIDPRNPKVIGLINPKIIWKSKEQEIEEEGCLSFPNIYLKIKRPREVEIEALNIESKKIQIKASGMLARVFQHEIDHLDGMPFFNRLSLLKKIGFKLKHPSIKL